MTIIILLILIVFSSIRINIEKCHISNIKNKIKTNSIEKEFAVFFEFYLLGFIKVFKIRVRKGLLEKIDFAKDKEMIKKEIKIAKSLDPIKILKKLKIKVKMAKLDLEFGTDSLMFTTYMVVFISSLIRNII